MGMSFTTLSLYGAERSALEAALAPGDLLRDRNLPWLTLVPAQEEEGDFPLRLEKAARRLTKGSDAVALLFFYYDDDAFVCRLYRNGRRAASCHSDESWAKLGKQLDELFGDTSASKAFRYSSRCSSLEEKLALLEETVGAALYDVPEEDALRCHAARGKGAGVDAAEAAQAVRSHGARGRKLAGGNEDHADGLPAAAAAMEAL